MEEASKKQIAIGLLGSVIIFTYFTFLGNVTGGIMIKQIEELSPSLNVSELFFFLSFIILIISTVIFLITILVNITNFSPISNLFRCKSKK